MRHLKIEMKLIIKLTLIILILSSCSSNKRIVGLYGKCEKEYLNCSQIELKENKTFEYYIFMGVGNENITRGTWKKNSDSTLELNIIEQFKITKTSYTKKEKVSLKNKSTDLNEIEEFVIIPIPHLSDKKVLIKKRKLIFNSNKHWSMYTLKKTRMKNKQWN